MAPIKRIVTFAAEVSLLNTVKGQTNWHNVRQRREPTTFSSSPRTSTYSPSSSGTSTTSSSVTAPSSSPAIPLSSITPTQVSTPSNATYIHETNNGSSSSSSSSVPTPSLTSGTTPQTTDDSSSPPIDGSSWPTYSPTVPTNSTSDNYGLSPSPTVLVGGDVSSSLPTPFLSGTSSSSPNGPGLTAPPTPFGTGTSISPTPSNSTSNGSTAPTSFGTGNATLSPTPSTSSSLSGSSSSPTAIQTSMNSTSPTSSTSSSPTILLTQAGISSAPSPSTSSSLGQTSYIPTPSGTGTSGSPTSFGTNNDSSGSPTPWGSNTSLSPTPLYHTHSSSPIASSGGNDYTWSYPTLGPTTSGSSTVTEDGTTTSPSASSTSYGSSSLVPSAGGSGGLGLSSAPTSSLTDVVSSLASNSPTSSLTDVVSSFAPSSSLTTSPTLGTGVGGMTTSPTSAVISSPTYSPSAVGAEATTESGVQSNSPTSSNSVLNEITTSPSSSPTTQQVLATSKPTISEISTPPLDESTQVTPDVGSYDEEILEGALDTSIIHKKESEENDPLHFDGHFKSSTENTISISSGNSDVSIAQQVYEHEMSDHNVVASEVEAYARIKEEERQAQLAASGIMRVKSSHITMEGQEYERLRDEFPQSEYAPEYKIQGIDLAENISSSVRISAGGIAMIASVLITWMLASG